MAVRRFSQGPPPLITQDRQPGEFTAEENARAYQLFRVLDQDCSGKISTREFKHFLAGHRTTFNVEFSTSDVGIVFGQNRYGEVVVVEIEKRSPAAAQDGLLLGLQLVAINSYEVRSGAENALQHVQTEMHRSLGKPTTFTFLDPLMVIREYTRTVDIQTDKNVFTLSLTPAAVNDYGRFVDEVNQLFKSVEPVSHIRLEMHQQHSVTFAFYSINGEPFRLLWGTGPTHGESVRYNLGFSAQDTPLHSRHEGAPASIDINLELTDGQLDILIAELFRLPNGDMREELEFDEFRDLYIKYFDLSDSIQSLKEWAQWKFKFAALEDELERQKLEQRLRKERMAKRKEKNAAIYRAQKEVRMQKMFVGSDGVRRVQRRFPEPPTFSDSHSVIRSMASLALESDLSDSEQSAMLSSARVSSARLSTTGKSQRSIPFSFANSGVRKARARAAASARKQKMIETGRLSARQTPQVVDQDLFDQSVHHPSAFFYTHEKSSHEARSDARITHPVFFTAQIIREPRRTQPNSVDLIRKVLGQHSKYASGNHTIAWTTYPSPPVNVGLVKRKFRDISKAYDNQEVCHPAIFGYRARWQSARMHTAQFTHPIFWGYSLDRPAAPITHSERTQKRKVNPFRYMPGQSCVVCGGGAPGCPLCWDPPGGTDILLDEAYNAKKERKRKALRQARKQHHQHQQQQQQHEGHQQSNAGLNTSRSARNRFGSMESEWARSLLSSDVDPSLPSMLPAAATSLQETSSRRAPKYGTVPLIGIDDHSSDEEDELGDDQMSLAGSSVSTLSQVPLLHTKLTTTLAVKNFRRLCRAYFNVWIKSMPSGKVVKVYADKHDPVWHLYNMYKSCVSDGIKRGGVLVLACSNGIYPLDNGHVAASDVALGYFAYQIQLKAYGMTSDVQDVALLRFENVTDSNVLAMLARYLKQNSTLTIDLDNVPLHETLAKPPDLQQGRDPVQCSLLMLLKGQYTAERQVRRARDDW